MNDDLVYYSPVDRLTKTFCCFLKTNQVENNSTSESYDLYIYMEIRDQRLEDTMAGIQFRGASEDSQSVHEQLHILLF